MPQARTVFAQLTDYLSWSEFDRCVKRYHVRYPTQTLSHWAQLLCMLFAQLTFRHSLRDLITCLGAHKKKLYHAGIREPVARSTLANANERRDWRIFRDLAQCLIAEAKRLYADDSTGLDVEQSVYAIDSSTVDLCLSLFQWAPAAKGRAGIKMHTVLDLRGNIPSVVDVTGSRISDMAFLDDLPVEPGSIYIMDRGYMHMARIMRFTHAGAFFVVRAHDDLKFTYVQVLPQTQDGGVVQDDLILLTGRHTRVGYPVVLRRVVFVDTERGKVLMLLTNKFDLTAEQISQLYRARWRIELFFKCIKQHLRIKSFIGNSENAVKVQIWSALSAYLLVAIVRKRLKSTASLHDMFQLLSLNLFETMPLQELLGHLPAASENDRKSQISLFETNAGQ